MLTLRFGEESHTSAFVEYERGVVRELCGEHMNLSSAVGKGFEEGEVGR